MEYMTRFEFLRSLLPSLMFNSFKDSQQPNEQPIEQLSLVKLIANPEKYDDKMILVDGFLRLEREGDVLYLHEEDYKYHLFKNGIWVVQNDLLMTKAGDLSNKYVTLVGTFGCRFKGHRSITSGSLNDITAAHLA